MTPEDTSTPEYRTPPAATVRFRRTLTHPGEVTVTRTRMGARFRVSGVHIELRTDVARQLALDLADALTAPAPVGDPQ